MWGTGSGLGFVRDGSHAEYLALPVAALATGGRIAVIAAPADGHVRLPVLALYRRGGSVIGINSLLHDPMACAAVLAALAAEFDQGHLPAPPEPRVLDLDAGPAAYVAIERGDTTKTVLRCQRD